jgi:hypothetical protein
MPPYSHDRTRPVHPERDSAASAADTATRRSHTPSPLRVLACVDIHEARIARLKRRKWFSVAPPFTAHSRAVAPVAATARPHATQNRAPSGSISPHAAQKPAAILPGCILSERIAPVAIRGRSSTATRHIQPRPLHRPHTPRCGPIRPPIHAGQSIRHPHVSHPRERIPGLCQCPPIPASQGVSHSPAPQNVHMRIQLSLIQDLLS